MYDYIRKFMVDRINLILKAKNLTSRQFAEEIGIQPSGMSHIMSGRNRPSLDFVMKVVNRYPEIDIKWLTLGEGEMYSTTNSVQKNENRHQPDLFSSLQEEIHLDEPEVLNEDDETDFTPSVAGETEAEYGLSPEQGSEFMANPSTEAQIISAAPIQNMAPNQSAALNPAPNPAPGSASGSVPNPVPSSAPSPSQSSVPSSAPSPIATPAPVPAPNIAPSPAPSQNQVTPSVNAAATAPLGKDEESKNTNRKRITKVVILYDDHTFAEYFPE